jgi:hypothetical protein
MNIKVDKRIAGFNAFKHGLNLYFRKNLKNEINWK